jgi:uncharacterized protein YuzE
VAPDKAESMSTHLTYDPKANAVYVDLGRGEIATTEEVSPNAILDCDDEQRVIGIEILNARETLAPGDWLTAPAPEARRANAAE